MLINITASDGGSSNEEGTVIGDDDHALSSVAGGSVVVKEEEVSNDEPVLCSLCGQVCDWESFGEEIWEECELLKGQGADNKQVWFHAYKMYTCLRHGVLRRFHRRPLPVCIRGEIMDSCPDPNHEYVGFHAALHDVVEES